MIDYKKSLIKFNINEWREICQIINRNNKDSKFWKDKIRRFASYNGRNLKDLYRKDFSKNRQDKLIIMSQILLDNSFKEFIKKKDEKIVNQAYINSAYYAIDTLSFFYPNKKTEFNQRLSYLQKDLKKSLKNLIISDRAKLDKRNKKIFDFLEKKNLRKKEVHSVIIISPNPRSLFSIITIKLCLHFGIKIDGIIIRKFTLNRFKDEFRRDGLGLFKKFWRKFIFQLNENNSNASISLAKFHQKICPEIRQISDFLKYENVKINYYSDLDESYEFVSKSSARVGLFTGGGYVGSKLRAALDKGIINIHMGYLPNYRGMDVVEATILEGNLDNVGLTSHLMNESIDTGPIIEQLSFSSMEFNNLGSLRNELQALMPIALINSFFRLNYDLDLKNNKIEEGKIYHKLHPKLKEIINMILKDKYKFKRSTFTKKLYDYFFKEIYLNKSYLS